MLADGPVFARNLNLLFLVVSSCGEDRSTLTAVQAGSLCNAFQLAKEMVVRTAFFIDEDPALMRSVLAPVFKQRDQ